MKTKYWLIDIKIKNDIVTYFTVDAQGQKHQFTKSAIEGNWFAVLRPDEEKLYLEL